VLLLGLRTRAVVDHAGHSQPLVLLKDFMFLSKVVVSLVFLNNNWLIAQELMAITVAVVDGLTLHSLMLEITVLPLNHHIHTEDTTRLAKLSVQLFGISVTLMLVLQMQQDLLQLLLNNQSLLFLKLTRMYSNNTPVVSLTQQHAEQLLITPSSPLDMEHQAAPTTGS